MPAVGRLWPSDDDDDDNHDDQEAGIECRRRAAGNALQGNEARPGPVGPHTLALSYLQALFYLRALSYFTQYTHLHFL